MPTKRPRLRYVDDLPDFHTTSGYHATNENLSIHHYLLAQAMKRGPVDKVACICSGGELPLQVFAPKVKKVVAIDFSKNSLVWALAKADFVQRYPPAKVRELLSNVDANKAPKQILSHREWLTTLVRLTKLGLSANTLQLNSDPERTWGGLSDAEIEAIGKTAGKIEFVHGEMVTHLKDRGPFDLFYTSNALTFGTSNPKLGCNQKRLIEEVVRPGGFVISTSHLGDVTHNLKVLEVLNGYTPTGAPNMPPGVTGGGSDSWIYYLGQRHEPAAQPPAALSEGRRVNLPGGMTVSVTSA